MTYPEARLPETQSSKPKNPTLFQALLQKKYLIKKYIWFQTVVVYAHMKIGRIVIFSVHHVLRFSKLYCTMYNQCTNVVRTCHEIKFRILYLTYFTIKSSIILSYLRVRYEKKMTPSCYWTIEQAFSNYLILPQYKIFSILLKLF